MFNHGGRFEVSLVQSLSKQFTPQLIDSTYTGLRVNGTIYTPLRWFIWTPIYKHLGVPVPWNSLTSETTAP